MRIAGSAGILARERDSGTLHGFALTRSGRQGCLRSQLIGFGKCY
jgi:hypothetical protein